jgi:predicted DCC family thiol-disulfide oxidoreductase YuxK
MAANRPHEHSWDVEVFYDGGCPLCRREIEMLRRWDQRNRIRFNDIASPEFDSKRVGVDDEELMAEIHARLPDGTLIRGVEVFRRLYTAVGCGWLVAVTRWPGVKQVLDFGYGLFARYRLRLTGRCETACQSRPRS